MKKPRENNGIKNQIMLPKAMPLGWIMLPFQGENGLGRFLTQGDAIGLGYSALSGRRRFGVLSAQGDAIGLGYAALSGRKWFGVFFYALKGQYNPAQRQRLGLIKKNPFYALKGQYTLAQRQRLGHKWNAVLSALKGQYNPAQRQRLGKNNLLIN